MKEIKKIRISAKYIDDIILAKCNFCAKIPHLQSIIVSCACFVSSYVQSTKTLVLYSFHSNSHIIVFCRQWTNRYNGGIWIPLQRSSDFEFITPNTGSNYTLRIPSYNPIKHGGKYRCEIQLYGGNPRQSPEFEITSESTFILQRKGLHVITM